MMKGVESEPFLQPFEKSDQRLSGAPAPVNKRISISSRLTTHFLVSLLTSLFWGALLHSLLRQNRHIGDETVPSNSNTTAENALPSTLITGAQYSLCGNSTAEARGMGCEYDILSNHWLPAPCMDNVAVQEYQADGSWVGYADEKMTERLPTIDAMSEVQFYYSNMRDHIVHCAMLWRKQYRAFFEERRGLDSIIVDQEHTDHCSDFLVRMTEFGPDFSRIPIKVEVGFAGCYVRD